MINLEELRQCYCPDDSDERLCNEAADELAQLRACYDAHRKTIVVMEETIEGLIEEIVQLRAALRDIYDARLAGDWVTEPLQWCAEVAKRALQSEDATRKVTREDAQ